VDPAEDCKQIAEAVEVGKAGGRDLLAIGATEQPHAKPLGPQHMGEPPRAPDLVSGRQARPGGMPDVGYRQAG